MENKLAHTNFVALLIKELKKQRPIQISKERASENTL
jgi:hypothetical protein